MKNVTSIILSLAVILLGTTAFTSGDENVKSVSVDTENSTVKWKAYKVTGEHYGTVKVKSGNLNFEDGMLTGGDFAINMASINCEDLSGKYKQKLENHLKSPDFFNVEEHPMATFEITNVVSRGTEGDYKVVGNFTIKDITKEYRFLVKVDEENKKAMAEFEIDRAEFNVRYGSGSFFDNLGDKTIYDNFDLAVELAY